MGLVQISYGDRLIRLVTLLESLNFECYMMESGINIVDAHELLHTRHMINFQ